MDITEDPIQQSQWIEQLALDELTMEESGVVHFTEHLDPRYHIEESGIRLMDRLKDQFEVLVRKFNQYRGGNQGAAIKVFKISNTVNDFMLFRNSLKLLVSRKATDVISIGFMSNSGGQYAARLNPNFQTDQMNHEIEAYIGPFNDISWRFQGEPVKVETLVKHYLTEFIKQSAQ